MKRRPAIIAYDIVSDARRRKVRRRLAAWRLDGQYSVCECRLAPREAEELFLQLADIIDEQEDRLLLAWMDNHHDARLLIGKGNIGFAEAGLYLG